MHKESSEMNQAGDEVMRQIGVLDGATEELKGLAKDCAPDADEVGSWITTIGRAVLAIFKG